MASSFLVAGERRQAVGGTGEAVGDIIALEAMAGEAGVEAEEGSTRAGSPFQVVGERQKGAVTIEFIQDCHFLFFHFYPASIVQRSRHYPVCFVYCILHI